MLREKEVMNYPFKALHELCMNACMHRDYQSNMPTRLYQYDRHIEIMNPGGLYGQARPENFPLVNDYRNSVIAEMMRTFVLRTCLIMALRKFKMHYVIMKILPHDSTLIW